MKNQYPFTELMHCSVGTLVRIDENGRAFVDFPDNESGLLEARLAFAGQLPDGPAEGTQVLLAFEAGDISLPIIIGFVHDSFPVKRSPCVIEASRLRPDELNVDGRQIRLTATDQVVLQCGRGSITIVSDGSIVIKGTRISSRSSETHKIRGATVRIN
jgi:hypothetical protein